MVSQEVREDRERCAGIVRSLECLGCLTGDCPHMDSADCREAIFAAFDAAVEEITSGESDGSEKDQ